MKHILAQFYTPSPPKNKRTWGQISKQCANCRLLPRTTAFFFILMALVSCKTQTAYQRVIPAEPTVISASASPKLFQQAVNQSIRRVGWSAMRYDYDKENQLNHITAILPDLREAVIHITPDSSQNQSADEVKTYALRVFVKHFGDQTEQQQFRRIFGQEIRKPLLKQRNKYFTLPALED